MRFIARSVIAALGLHILPACSAPPTDLRWIRLPELTQEFSSTSNEDLETGYYLTSPFWKGRPPSTFKRDALSIQDGSLSIRTRKVERTPSGSQAAYETGALVSKKKLLYGYFEIRAKLGRSKASGAFWLYSHDWPNVGEIDIFEACGHPACGNVVHTNIHRAGPGQVKGIPAETSPEKIPLRAGESLLDWNVYGLLWTPSKIVWYLNGRQIRSVSEHKINSPLRLVVDSEIFESWFGLPEDASLPSDFLIDYIRVWAGLP